MAIPKICLFILGLMISSGFSIANSIGGYVEDLPFITVPFDNSLNVHTNNILQVRLNTKWYPCDPVTVEASGRLLWYGGQDFKETGAIAAQLQNNPGVLGLKWAQGAKEAPLVLFENIDRLSCEISKGKLSFTVGRQRINWGTNLVWNPNDWFNAFNFLDFLYLEHPGADAVRLQYYLNATSVAEVAFEAGKTQSERNFAVLYKFNMWKYDWQFQSGLIGNDLAAGFSWSGSIKGAGFRGELSWYKTLVDGVISDSQRIVASFSGDYTFSNSLYVHASFLYNGFGASDDSGSTPLTLVTQITARSLIPKKYALFGEIAYQLTPLMKIDLATTASPTDRSFYILPSFTLSILDNVDLLAIVQISQGKKGTLYGGASDILALSLKWSY